MSEDPPYFKTAASAPFPGYIINGKRCLAHDGTPRWQFGPAVASAHVRWSGDVPWDDNETTEAGSALRMALRHNSGDGLRPKDIEQVIRSLVLPLLVRLDRNDQQRSKERAAQWVSDVLDEVFPNPAKQAKQVVGLIDVGFELCQLRDRLPLKKELWKEARLRDPALFTVGETKEAELLKMAGLDNLPRARSGGRKPQVGR